MISAALGPGSGVLISGTFCTAVRCLLALPAGAGGAVFENNALRLEIAPNLVGPREIPRVSRGAALGNEPLDLLSRNRRLRVFRAAQRHHAEDTIELVECLAHHGGIGRGRLAP